MHKTIIYSSILFSVLISCSDQDRKKENVEDRAISEWSDHLKFYSNVSIDIRLYELPKWITQDEAVNNTRSFTGVIEVLMPQVSDIQFLCFPHSFTEFYQAYLFAHTTCRKLGYMTLVTISGEEFPNLLVGSGYHGMKLDSHSCFDREQIVSRCRWNAVGIKNCQNVTKVTCGECQKLAKGFNGVIRSPGFPYAYLNDVTCEWTVSVPEKHFIHLSFHHFEEMADESTSLPCSVDQPYVEIMNGIQSKVTVNRFCRFKESANMTIPFHTVKILIFTGISSFKEKLDINEKKGFSITFKAVPPEGEELGSPMKLVSVSLLGLIFVSLLIVCRYIHKHEMCNCCIPKYPDLAEEEVQDVRRENNVTKNDIQIGRKGLSSNVGFSYNTPKPEKEPCKRHSSLQIPKSSTQIAMHSYSDGKRVEGGGGWWMAEKKALRRYASYNDRNRLSVTAPLLYDSASRDRNLLTATQTGTEERKKSQSSDTTRNEPFSSVVPSFFN